MGRDCVQAMSHRLSLFIDAYVNSHNAAQAAVVAGYSIRSARKTGYRLLQRADVAKAIRERQTQVARDVSCETDRVIQALARIIRFNPARLFSDDGGLLSLSALPEEVSAGIASVEIRVHPNGTSVTRYRFHDKVAAIDKAMRLLGLYDSPRHSSTDSISALIHHVAMHNQPLISEATGAPEPG